jgi:hypothetical protein
MGSIVKRFQVLVALCAGAFFGAMSCGCFLVWLGVARAGTPVPQGEILTVSCDVPGTNGLTFAVQEFPGATAYDLQASVFVAAPPPTGTAGTIQAGGVTYYPGALTSVGATLFVKDGAVAAVCANGASSIQLYVRP